MRIGEYLEVVDEGGSKKVKCVKCGHIYGPASENPKKFARMKVFPQTKAGPRVNPWVKRDDFELREFYCPKCATMFSVELTKKDEPILWDSQVSL